MSIIPSRLYHVKLFEHVEKFVENDGGLLRAGTAQPTIEEQIERWVRETGSLVRNTGPLHVMSTRDREFVIERRTLAVIYAPPVEHGDVVYGQQQEEAGSEHMGQVVVTPKPSGPVSAARLSDGRF